MAEDRPLLLRRHCRLRWRFNWSVIRFSSHGWDCGWDNGRRRAARSWYRRGVEDEPCGREQEPGPDRRERSPASRDRRGAAFRTEDVGHVERRQVQRPQSPVACTGFAEDKQFATATTGGPFYLEVDQTVEPADGGTTLTIHYRGDSRGFFKLAEPLVIRLTKRQVETAAGNLKALLERTRSNREC